MIFQHAFLGKGFMHVILSGAPNERFFPKTSEHVVSNGFLYVLEAFLVNLEMP